MSEILQEKWMKGVAITTTVLAVMTAIVSARSTTCVSKIQILTALEGSKWNYFQAKSIKHNFVENQRRTFTVDALGATSPEQRAALQSELTVLDGEIVRYQKEKDQIMKEAQDVGAQNLYIQKQNNQFTISVVFFQIAIMLSSVSALMKRKELWIAGLLFGVVAIFFFANGFFMFYKLPITF